MNIYWELINLVWDNDVIIWLEVVIFKLEMLVQDFIIDMNVEVVCYDMVIIIGVVNYNFESQEVWNNLIVLGKFYVDDEQGYYCYFYGNCYVKYYLLFIGEFVFFEDLLWLLVFLFDLFMLLFSCGDF